MKMSVFLCLVQIKLISEYCKLCFFIVQTRHNIPVTDNIEVYS